MSFDPKSQKPCPQCGLVMHRQSKQCRLCYAAMIAAPENYVTHPCEKCATVFTVHKCHTERGMGRYCSIRCARSGSPTRKRTIPIMPCIVCGKPVKRTPADMRKKKTAIHCCSVACWYQYNQREHHYLWGGGQHPRLNPDGRMWRRSVIKRDRNRCRICGTSKKLEAHHIRPFRSHPEDRWLLTNGITVCQTCHRSLGRNEMEWAEVLTGLAKIPLNFWHELHLLGPQSPEDLSDGASLSPS